MWAMISFSGYLFFSEDRKSTALIIIILGLIGSLFISYSKQNNGKRFFKLSDKKDSCKGDREKEVPGGVEPP